MRSMCIVIFYTTVCNLNQAQYKPLRMRNTVTYYHDYTSCVLIAGDYPSSSIRSASHGRRICTRYVSTGPTLSLPLNNYDCSMMLI